jgi:hypothetical protein
MTTTRWIRSGLALLMTFACTIDSAWCADATPPSQPNTTVSSDGATPAKNAKTDSTPSKPATPSKSTQSTPKSDDKDKDFKPSEEVSEDMSVAYPSDI